MRGLKARYKNNARNPKGFMGRLLLSRMNRDRHEQLACWGLSHVTLEPQAQVLDCGCGGGANVARLLAMTQGRVMGLDYSSTAVSKSKAYNKDAIKMGRCKIIKGDVSKFPFEDESFDVITAFETIYFWPNLPHCFSEVSRVLKSGGIFMITNETSGKTSNYSELEKTIDGFAIYSADQIQNALRQAGFSTVDIDWQRETDFLCVVAYK